MSTHWDWTLKAQEILSPREKNLAITRRPYLISVAWTRNHMQTNPTKRYWLCAIGLLIQCTCAADSPTVIWYSFMDFNTDFYERRKAEGFSRGDLRMMPVSEYIAFCRDWLKDKA
jgi:hypothetical protein